MIIKKKGYKLLQKKLTRLRINPYNNNKFLYLILKSEEEKIIYEKIAGRIVQKKITVKRFEDVPKKRKKKWDTFLRHLVRANKFFQKYKPYTFNHYSVTKFASQGTSHKKIFRKDLFIKKIFHHHYGGFKKHFLKRQMTKIYMRNQNQDSRIACIQLFESRLDSVLRKAKFCESVKDARQLISHKHVYLNKKLESNYSYTLSSGDLIQIPNSKSRRVVKVKLYNQFVRRFNKVLWPMVPSYLEVNYRTLDIIFTGIKNFNLSSTFNFKNDNSRVVESYRRH